VATHKGQEWECAAMQHLPDAVTISASHCGPCTSTEYLTENLMVTCSGNFSSAAFLCTVMALGVDNVMFSVDWPYESNVAAVEFLERQALSGQDLAKIAHLNAERVLRL